MSNTNLSTLKTDYTQPELRNRLKFKQFPSNNHIISLLFAMTLLLLYFKAEATTSDNSTQNDIEYTIKYDENFNPVVCGTISNNKGKAITSVEITMHYLECGNDNGWKQTKVAHVFINSGEQGSFQIKFDKSSNGKPAYMFTLERIRYADGTVTNIKKTQLVGNSNN